MKTTWIVAACAAPALAVAQPMIDLPGSTSSAPAPPASPSPSRLYPAGLAPPATAETGNAPRTGDKGAPRRGSAIIDEEGAELDAAETGDGDAPSADRVPEGHTVKKGDTLWDISNFYFRNPWYWPKLWSFNPLITNPHWIYPGDLVRLYPPGADRPLMPTPAPTENEPETPRISVGRPASPSGVMLRQNGFVERGELDAAATIVGSKEEKIMLATLDEAYVEYRSDKPLKVGERYPVYRQLEEVKHPETGEVAGSIVEIMGEVEVRAITEGRIAKAVIVDASNPIERGYKVGPLRRQFRIVEPSPNRENIDAVVLATILPTKLLGTDMLIFLDRGREDRVEVGNRFVAVRRGDGYQPLLTAKNPDDPRYPREVIAEILVIDVRDRTSTAVVTRSIKEAKIGDRLEARKGY